MAFDFSVNDSELGGHISRFDRILTYTQNAKESVSSPPNVIAWTEFAAQILGDHISEFFTSYRDDTISAHSAITETQTQVENVRAAYQDLESTNQELIAEVTTAIDAMPKG